MEISKTQVNETLSYFFSFPADWQQWKELLAVFLTEESFLHTYETIFLCSIVSCVKILKIFRGISAVFSPNTILIQFFVLFRFSVEFCSKFGCNDWSWMTFNAQYVSVHILRFHPFCGYANPQNGYPAAFSIEIFSIFCCLAVFVWLVFLMLYSRFASIYFSILVNWVYSPKDIFF